MPKSKPCNQEFRVNNAVLVHCNIMRERYCTVTWSTKHWPLVQNLSETLIAAASFPHREVRYSIGMDVMAG